MPFTTKALSELPKRQPPKAKEVDLAAANELFAILSKDGKPAQMADPSDAKKRVTVTAEDGVTYESVKAARNEANKAKRLLAHVKGDDLFVATRVYPVDGGTAWAIWLTTEAPAPRAAKSA